MTKEQDTEEREPIKISFSLPQIIGGALAAATAAAIGSRLGVAGTIFGAAVASIVGGVGGTLYSAGIDRTHRRVTEAIQRGYERVRTADDYDADATAALDTGAGDTQLLPAADGGAKTEMLDTIFRTPQDQTRIDPAAPATPAGGAPHGPSGRSRRFWTVTALSIGAIFLGALLAITAVELGLGRALNGDGGTTIGQVVPGSRTSPKPTPTATPTATTPTPSVTPTTTPTPTDTPTPTVTAPTTAAPTPASGTTDVPTAGASGTP